MAVYNGFPAGYQPAYYPQQNAQQNGIIWVQGEAGAKSYLVAPNNTVQLWDSESNTIYLKSADASGLPSMKVLDYKIRVQANTVEPASSEFATKDEIKKVSDQLAALREKVEKIVKEADDV